MAIAAETGRVEPRPCSHCSVVMEHRESVVFTSSGPVTGWGAVKHCAPCGLPCLGGGVKRPEYRAKQVHGMKLGSGDVLSCARCGVWTATRGSTP